MLGAERDVDAGTYLQTLTKLERFVGPFVAAHRAGVTGRLLTVAEEVPTVVHFEQGMPVHVERGRLSLTLGRLLVERALLTEERYETLMQAISRTSSSERLGAVAVSHGFLSEQQLDAALGAQMHEKLLACFESTAPRTRFAWAAKLDPELPRRAIELEPIVFAGVRRFFGRERSARVLEPFAAQYPVLIGDPARVARAFGFKARERELLGLLDGGLAIEAVIRTSALDELHAAQIVASLLFCVQLGLHAQPQKTGASIQSKHVLRVAVPAPAKVVAERVLRKLGAPTQPPAAEASERVRAVQRRKAAKAELLFRRAKRALAQGRPQRALVDLKKAADMVPDAAEYALYAAWAELQTRTDGDEASKARARVKDMALRAIRAEPRQAFAHYAYASMLLSEGDERGALRAFRIAAALDATNLDAKRFVRVLSRRLK